MTRTAARRPQQAAFVVFFATGLVAASWAASIAAVADRLRLGAGAVGLVVLSIEAGALLGLGAGGVLVAHLGCRRSLRLGFLLYAASLPPAGALTSLAALAAMLALWACANSVVDVAMNVVGVELEARSRRPVLPALHAGHSLGLLTGSFIAVAATAAAVPLVVRFAAVAAGCVTMTWVAVGALPPPARPLLGTKPSSVFTWPGRRLTLLGILAFCGFLIDGAANYWVAFELRTEHSASPTVAVVGYCALTLAVAVVRLTGDRILAKFGPLRVVRGSGLACVCGVAMVVGAPAAVFSIVGWSVVGAGLALLAPTVLGATRALDGMSTATAIAAVSTIGYVGSFTGPPLIGALAELTSLHTAVGLLGIAAAASFVVAPLALPRKVVRGE